MCDGVATSWDGEIHRDRVTQLKKKRIFKVCGDIKENAVPALLETVTTITLGVMMKPITSL